MASLALPAYLGLTAAFSPLAAPILRRRLARGKEDPARWREKLGQGMAPRPGGRVVWLHAVGLGEVLALRGLIPALAGRLPGATFVVTSTTRASAAAFDAQAPEGAVHQFLPLDFPGPVGRFLAHWRPALAVWAEQDLWPRMVVAAARRGVPLALVNARMDAAARARRARARGMFAALYGRFGLISAQDAGTAANLAALGARGVRVDGALKSAAPPLACDPASLAVLRAGLAGRRVWLAASTHAGDEAVALAAHARLMQDDPEALLILAPRFPDRGDVIAAACPLPLARRSRGQGLGRGVYLADSLGEMGLWYRLAPVALIGGGFGIGGHNPWEAARLGVAILHGPDVPNFRNDYKALHDETAAVAVGGADALHAALHRADLPDIAARGRALAGRGMAALPALADALAGMVR